MAAFFDHLVGLLDDPDFVETVEYIASGADPSTVITVHAIVERKASDLERAPDAGEYWNNAVVKLLGPIGGNISAPVYDSVHGGIATPAVGDRWGFPLLRQGIPNLHYWKAGSPTGGNGCWIIPVKFHNRYETGGQRKHAGA